MRRHLAVIALLMIGTVPLCAQGTLSRIREEVHGAPAEKPPRKQRYDDYDDCDDDESILGAIIGALLFGSSDDECTPCGQVDDEEAPPDRPTVHTYFPQYPYQDPFDGYAQNLSQASQAELPHLRGWMGRLSIENGNDFDGLNRANVSLLLLTSSGLGVQSRLNFLHEDLPNDASDDLILGTTDLVYYFLTAEMLQSFLGIGVSYLDDQTDTDFGVNVTFGFDAFPADPFVISMVLDVGNVGAATVAHVRGTFGVVFRRFELFAGYDYRSIGDVSVHGPLVGARLWF